jgi:hypothetical protein
LNLGLSFFGGLDVKYPGDQPDLLASCKPIISVGSTASSALGFDSFMIFDKDRKAIYFVA